LARFQVKLPAMPWANDLAAFDCTVGQRTSLMNALVIQGTQFPVDPRNTDRVPAEQELFRLTFSGHFRLRGEFYEFRHSDFDGCKGVPTRLAFNGLLKLFAEARELLFQILNFPS